MLARLNVELAETTGKEEEELERLAEEARQKAGAFPILLKQGTSPSASASPQSHKVLSLNAKTKKVMVSSYNQSPSVFAAGKRVALVAEESPEDAVQRVTYLERSNPGRGSMDLSRPWADASREDRDFVYVRDPLIDREEIRRARRERKQEAREREGVITGAN